MKELNLIFQVLFETNSKSGITLKGFPLWWNKSSLNHQSYFNKIYHHRYFIRIFCWQFTFVQMLHFRLKFLYCHLLHFWYLNDQFESKVPNRTKNKFGHDQFWLYSSQWMICQTLHLSAYPSLQNGLVCNVRYYPKEKIGRVTSI